ncbi:MAG: fibronectin type III domain-containing protein, partial [Acutalibacteraceae bacterium]
NLSAGKDYLYSVKAYVSEDSKITYGKSSSAIYASTCPTKVSSVKVSKITASSYTLSWKKISSATSYIVYRYNESKKTYEKYKTVTGTSLKISGTAGQTKKYKVAAVRKKQSFSAVGAKSDTAYGFVKPGTVSVKATGKTKSVSLSWKGVKGATRYEIYIKSGNSYKKLKVLSSDKRSYTKTGLKKGVTYTFKVRAVTKHGSTESYGDFKTVSAKAK